MANSYQSVKVWISPLLETSEALTQNRNGVTHMFDVKNLTRLKKLDENAPETMKAFWAFDKEAFKNGAIDVLHKQLMAGAVALTTQCPYCIELHVRAARQAGANDAMQTEAAIVAADARGRVDHARDALVQRVMRANVAKQRCWCPMSQRDMVQLDVKPAIRKSG
jgi:AhpD family alkylhydroperoxidase